MGRGLSELQKTMLTMAYKNRLGEGEPADPPTRVIVLDDPREKDLRVLVPEAFDQSPDGYWERRSVRFYLVVESFSQRGGTWEVRKRRVEDLSLRGLAPYESHSTCYQCDLFSSDVLCQLYGFQERHLSAGAHPPGFADARIVRVWRNCFTEGALNNSARVSVSRAFDRLATRGLAERRGCAINLTAEGLAEAERVNG